MNTSTGFAKVYRSITNHWISKDPKQLKAWVFMLLKAEYQGEQRGVVNLTEVMKACTKDFSRGQWRHFIVKLTDDGMIEPLETVNHGQGKGKEQYALVTNYGFYHAHPANDDTFDDPAHPNVKNIQQTPDSDSPNPMSTTMQTQQPSKHSANNQANNQANNHDVSDKQGLFGTSATKQTFSKQPSKHSANNHVSIEVNRSKKNLDISSPKKSKAKYNPSEAELPPCVDRDTWVDFCTYRAEIKKPLGKLAATRVLNRLESYPDQANTLLDEAIEKGWLTVYPKKDSPKAKKYSGQATPAADTYDWGGN